MSGLKWTRRTTSKISAQLATLGIAAGVRRRSEDLRGRFVLPLNLA